MSRQRDEQLQEKLQREDIRWALSLKVAEAVQGERVALLPLLTLIELKLASGMSAPDRLRDLADVIELVRILHLPEEMAEDLHPYVREKYREMWRAAQSAERE